MISFNLICFSGGKQPKMRAGYYRRGPLKIKQHMVYQEGPNTGLAKGLKAVCCERFGEEAILGIQKV